MTPLEARCLAIFAVVGMSSLGALILGQLGQLRGVPLLALVAIVAAAVVAWRVRDRHPPAPSTVRSVEVIGVIVLCVVLFFRPHEALVQGNDATVYANWGRKVAEAGALAFEDPFVAAMPAAARAEWFANRTMFRGTGRLSRFPGGFQVASADDPTVTASFAPMFPVVSAVLHRLGIGDRGPLYVSPVFATFSVVALFLVAAHLGGRRAGWLAALLTIGTMPQLWFARLPVPEVMAQCFVTVGLLAWLVAQRADRRSLAVAAGFFLGLAGAAKVDLNVLLPVSLAAFGAWQCLAATPRRWLLPWVLAGYCPVVAFNVAHYFIVPADYVPAFERLIERSVLLPYVEPIAVVAVLVVAALALVVWRVRPPLRDRIIGAVLCLGTAGYFANYFVTIPMRFVETLTTWSWYVPWPVLVVAAAAVVWLVVSGRARRDHGIGLALALLAASGLTYFYSELESAVHIFTARRYVPVVLPMMMLVAALGVDAVVRRCTPGFGTSLTWSAGLILVSLVLRPSLPVIGRSFWSDALSQTATVARTFQSGSVLLMSPELAGTHVATTLGYMHDANTLLVQDRNPRSGLVVQSVADWHRAGRQVFFVFGRDGFSTFAPTLRLGEPREALIEIPMLEATRGRLPQASVMQSIRMRAYPVTRRVLDPVAVDVGDPADDALYDLRGFHEPERTSEGRSFRWTRREASLRVPVSDVLVLTLGGERPAGVPPAEATVWIAGCQVLDVELANVPEDFVIPVPSTSESSVQVTIRTTSFNPAELGLVQPDVRDLGVRVYRVAFAADLQGQEVDGRTCE